MTVGKAVFKMVVLWAILIATCAVVKAIFCMSFVFADRNKPNNGGWGPLEDYWGNVGRCRALY